ncbi:MAG: hypothetical protein LIO51_01580 [Clostridiales bacterium]|nr:hypothetical protein [Clostridiales bacterium]
MLFRSQAEQEFQVRAARSTEMDEALMSCAYIYRGTPEWAGGADGVRTVHFARSVCAEVARLTTLAIGIRIDGGDRGAWLQSQIDRDYFQLRAWVEQAAAYGTVLLKPNGRGFDLFTPFDIILVSYSGDEIQGVIFKDSYVEGEQYYTRLEYHRFEQGEDGSRPYYISNRAFVSRSEEALGRRVALEETHWAGLMEETPPILKANGESLDGPMFGVLRMPGANHIAPTSPLGLPVFCNALEELRDLDVAYSRNAGEIFDSEKLILADDRLLLPDGTKVKGKHRPKLPHYVRNVFGSGAEDFYQEIVPSLNTETRLTGINALLSQMGYKCGFSNGYFVFSEKTGMVTATQVEADDRRTIQLIKDVRDRLESCLDGAIYALSVYADLYALAPAGMYQITYDFGDITFNAEEDKQTWWKYVTQGKVPFWYYLTKFEGFTETEARALEQAAQPKDGGLFGEE